ncbi:hypothetical protein LCGC14_2839720, partial [marine sediment metagenome]
IAYPFDTFDNVVWDGNNPPTEHGAPAGSYTPAAGDIDDVVIIDDDGDSNTIQFDANIVAEALAQGVIVYLDQMASLPSTGATVKRVRFLVDASVDNSGGGTTPYYFIATLIDSANLLTGDPPTNVGMFELEADGVAVGRTTLTSPWYTAKVDKFPQDFEIINDTTSWEGIRLLVWFSDKSGSFHTSNSGKIYKDGFKIEIELNQEEPVSGSQDFSRLGVSYTDPAGQSGIRLFSGIGGQDYTILSDYAANYQNKGGIVNAIRFFLQERCGVAASQIDDASFNGAWTNEFEGLNTGGSPVDVDMDIVFMEHEFGETFTQFMTKFCHELTSQIIVQHRQTEDVFFWHVGHDPSTSQIDGLSYEYPTPTRSITEWSDADENLKDRDEVYTHWNFFWSLKRKG